MKSKIGRKIGQVAHQFGEGGAEEEDWQQHWDTEGREHGTRTALKRARTEERKRKTQEDVRTGKTEGGEAGGKKQRAPNEKAQDQKEDVMNVEVITTPKVAQ